MDEISYAFLGPANLGPTSALRHGGHRNPVSKSLFLGKAEDSLGVMEGRLKLSRLKKLICTIGLDHRQGKGMRQLLSQSKGLLKLVCRLVEIA